MFVSDNLVGITGDEEKTQAQVNTTIDCDAL